VVDQLFISSISFNLVNTFGSEKMAKFCYVLFAWSSLVIGTLSAAVSKRATVSYIVPGAVWYDTDGVRIDAHGGQVWQQGSTFYWIGSSYADSMPTLFLLYTIELT
jgi:hypothetical protein